jgi:hypothetical protein
MTEVTLTHIGGPTVLLEVEGWRLLTDPTFGTPGRRYTLGGGRPPKRPAVTEPRLYQLIRQPVPVGERTFEITFLDADVQATPSPSASPGGMKGVSR